MIEDFKPIFIVGVGRSGTSLLQGMLNSHKEISFPPETHFIRSYISRNKILEDVKEKLLNDKDLLKLNIPLEIVFSESTNLNNFYIKLLIRYMRKQNKKIVGDKDPKNIEYLKLIHSIFPNAIIIHIYRDPRAVIASRMKAKWSLDKPFWQHLLAYKSQLNYGRNIGKELFTNYIEIKYENLVQDPVYELEYLCKSINLEFDNNMIEFYRSASDIVQGNELSWKNNLFNPLMKDNIDKWKKVLSKNQKTLIEYVLEKEMNLLGYTNMEVANSFYKIKNQIYKYFLDIAHLVYTTNLK